MEKRMMQKIFEEVSLLGFGCMRLPQKDGTIDYETAEKLVDMALEGGITYFDTAYYYHDQQSEKFLGKALTARHPRDTYTIATKMPLSVIQEADDLERTLDLQLSRLNTSYIDFYLCHGLSADAYFNKFKPMGVVEFLERMVAAGKIRYYGFSTHDKPEGVKKLIDDAKWDFVQMQLNYLDWTEQDAKTTYANLVAKDIPVVVMEPIRGGSLANLADGPRQMLERKFAGQTAASVALRWAASLPGVRVVLSGMTTPAQMEENLATFNAFKPLSDADRLAITNVVTALKALPVIPCTSCNYCNVCPNDIAIPRIFARYNNYIMFERPEELVFPYERFIEEGHRAEDCEACGICVPFCPQSIDIPGWMQRVVEKRAEVKAGN
ncbi:MAG: aldo/keto reductase [Clostridia bacterium]|nr:aldo/keto reductase [Clostridia bacterium]